MLNLEKFGQKIILLRKQKDMNQKDLAEKLFVTHQAVSKWENGRSLPSIDVLYTLTKIFDVSMVPKVLVKAISTIILKICDMKKHASILKIRHLVNFHILLLVSI